MRLSMHMQKEYSSYSVVIPFLPILTLLAQKMLHRKRRDDGPQPDPERRHAPSYPIPYRLRYLRDPRHDHTRDPHQQCGDGPKEIDAVQQHAEFMARLVALVDRFAVLAPLARVDCEDVFEDRVGHGPDGNAFG